MHRLNEMRVPGIITQGVSQFANTDFQNHIAYHSLRPDRLQQALFGQQLAGMFHKASQDSEGFWPQGKRLCQAP